VTGVQTCALPIYIDPSTFAYYKTRAVAENVFLANIKWTFALFPTLERRNVSR
jgi:hypothetical protein